MNVFRAWQQAVLGNNETVNGSITYNSSSAQATFVQESKVASHFGLWPLNSGSFVSDLINGFRAVGNLDGMFGYLASPWALSTFFVVSKTQASDLDAHL